MVEKDAPPLLERRPDRGSTRSSTQPEPTPARLRPGSGRVVIEHVRPAVDDGRFPIKRTPGEWVDVVADIFADAYDELGAILRHRPVRGNDEHAWRPIRMSLLQPGTDQWTARFEIDQMGWHEYSIVAWVDRFQTWRRDVRVKASAAYLQEGGRPAFEARLVLAATLGASYGIYSGFEVCERRAVPDSEEYADSEKYQYRRWDWNRPESIAELVARINQIRRRHRALQEDRSLRFHETSNSAIIAYTKSSPDGRETLLMIVSLDPRNMQHGLVRVPLDRLQASGGHPDRFEVRDLLDGTAYSWRGEWNYVSLDPGVRQAHLFALGAA